ncbi:MBL fold metallo-hydrolase [Cytobacillus depressus]|uniref:MBL fold metallo-hydrolase n=1 Tax=Cytobacillus depressus TaxID=1602942 RepID=A0A6L3V079_9BACI|nr:MBL fold metallo-hydrolase [Cytobacillus depressus]KAB2330458.1 MBL fold metallo-hydrolase [Cytobacillus depressus]
MIEINSYGNVTSLKGFVKYKDISLPIHLFFADHMLIDTGPFSLLPDLIPFFQRESFDFVALTHVHEDHTGNANWIQENKEVPIYIHPMSVDECLHVKEYHPFRQGFWGIREGFTAQPLKESLHSRKDKWRVVHTPGHSNDHMVFLNTSTGILFSGDLLVGVKPKGILPDESIAKTIESLNTVLSLDFQEMFCAHSGYFPNGKILLKEKKEWLGNLQADILHLYKQGLSVPEINQKLFPSTQPLISVSENEWDSIHIINNVLKSSFE